MEVTSVFNFTQLAPSVVTSPYTESMLLQKASPRLVTCPFSGCSLCSWSGFFFRVLNSFYSFLGVPLAAVVEGSSKVLVQVICRPCILGVDNVLGSSGQSSL